MFTLSVQFFPLSSHFCCITYNITQFQNYAYLLGSSLNQKLFHLSLLMFSCNTIFLRKDKLVSSWQLSHSIDGKKRAHTRDYLLKCFLTFLPEQFVVFCEKYEILFTFFKLMCCVDCSTCLCTLKSGMKKLN